MINTQVTVSVPDEEQIEAALQPFIDAALSAAEQVPKILKDQAKFQNEDVDGNQMQHKQPRPQGNPTNLPNQQLIETGDMMLGDERWSHERTGEATETVTFDPPEHLQYLIDKDPAHGGRKWITPDKINPNARQKIEAEVQLRLESAKEA